MRKFLFCAVALGMLAQGCNLSKEERNDVNKQTVETLMNMYPNAENVAWRFKNNYAIADFTTVATKAVGSSNHSAWFNKSGKWYMTEVDITFQELPEAVKTAFNETQYASWRVDDVDKIVRQGAEVVYVIEVEDKNTEIDLYFSETGVLVKEFVDVEKNNDYEDYIVNDFAGSVKSYVSANYPNARIIDVDVESNGTEVEILDGRVKRELLFDKSGECLYVKTEIRYAQVPQNIQAVLSGSEYASYRVDDVDYYVAGGKEFYVFELESSKGDVKLQINLDGTYQLASDLSGNKPSYGNFSGTINNAIKDFISSKYSGAKIKEYEVENGYLEVEFIHNGKEKTIRFAAENKWVDTHWDVEMYQLPKAVLDAIGASGYTNYKFDDAEFYQTETVEYYEVELEKGESEVVLKITTQGILIK